MLNANSKRMIDAEQTDQSRHNHGEVPHWVPYDNYTTLNVTRILRRHIQRDNWTKTTITDMWREYYVATLRKET